MVKKPKFEFHLGWQLVVFLLVFLGFLFAPVYPVKYTVIDRNSYDPVPNGEEGISFHPLSQVLFRNFEWYGSETYPPLPKCCFHRWNPYDIHLEANPIFLVPSLLKFIFISFIIFGGIDRLDENVQRRKERTAKSE